jgi:hypothetical protein
MDGALRRVELQTLAAGRCALAIAFVVGPKGGQGERFACSEHQHNSLDIHHNADPAERVDRVMTKNPGFYLSPKFPEINIPSV